MSKHNAITQVLLTHAGMWFTVNELRTRSGVPVGTEITAPIRRARAMGYDIRCRRGDDCYRYAYFPKGV